MNETAQEVAISPVKSDSVLCVDDNPMNRKVSWHKSLRSRCSFHLLCIASYHFYQEQKSDSCGGF